MHIPWAPVLSLSLLLSLPSLLSAQETLRAPNSEASPINQRRAYGNACGPASLLNAFQYGSTKWQKAFDAVPGNNSRTRLHYVVKVWGNKPSQHIKGVMRWNRKQGINLLDLTDMANEMRAAHFLPKIKHQILTAKPRESRADLLRRTHAQITKSLKKGLPPILSIRRYAYRYHKDVGGKSWWPIRAHFVVVTEIPKRIPRGATSFNIKYIDPYGGFLRRGQIHCHTGKFQHNPFLAAHMPKSLVGKSLLRSGEPTVLSFTAIIGTW